MNTMKVLDLIQSAKSSYPWINSTESGVKLEHGKYTVLLTPRKETNSFIEKTYLSTVAGDRWQVWNFLKDFPGWDIEIQPETEKETEEETGTEPEVKKETQKETEETKYKNISEEFEEEEE